MQLKEELRKKIRQIGDVVQVYLSEKTQEDQIFTFLVKEDFIPTHQDYAIHIDRIMEVLLWATQWVVQNHKKIRNHFVFSVLRINSVTSPGFKPGTF